MYEFEEELYETDFTEEMSSDEMLITEELIEERYERDIMNQQYVNNFTSRMGFSDFD